MMHTSSAKFEDSTAVLLVLNGLRLAQWREHWKRPSLPGIQDDRPHYLIERVVGTREIGLII